MSRFVVLLGLLSLVAAPSRVQTPSISLPPRSGVITEPFSDVYSMAEFLDGRVVVSDRISGDFTFADFSTGASKVLGRRGAGPDEYQLAGGVTKWRGDTLLGYDGFGSRVIRIAPGGVLAGTIPYPTRRRDLSLRIASSVDRAGRLYYDAPVIQRPVIKRSKTALILRWMPGVDSIEKVGEYTDHDDFDDQYRYTPYPKRDSWVLGSDGRIGVISVDRYQLTWFADGKAVETGPAISFVPVRVTRAERDAFRAEKALEGAAGGGGPTQTPAARRAIGEERARQYWGDSLFSATLPPFAERAALMSPNGEIWVRRLGPAAASQLKVDILDAQGALRAVLSLPPKRRLMALGARFIYVVFTDDDGFQILERYPYPAIPR